MRLFTLVALLGFVSGCASTDIYVAPAHSGWASEQEPVDSLLTYRVFLIGDAGEPTNSTETLKLLRRRLLQQNDNSAVVFLGDNVYPRGLVDTSASGRDKAEQALLMQIDAVRGFRGKVIFTPGNHDWNYLTSHGAEAVRRQEAFVESRLGERGLFLPDSAFPGPVEIKLNKHLNLVAIDTEWWLYKGPKPFGTGAGYDLEVRTDMLVQLDDVVRRNEKSDLLVIGHHPVFSNGSHAGQFPAKIHLFPLTSLRKEAWIPLPVLGSLYVLLRRYIGSRQDFASTNYHLLRTGLRSIFAQHPGLIYAAGHEHALEYYEVDGQSYVVSGAGSKREYVSPGKGATFAAGRNGFAELSYYKDGKIVLLFRGTASDSSDGSRLFQTTIREAHSVPAVVAGTDSRAITGPNVEPVATDSVIVAAGPQYGRSRIAEVFAGKEHRVAWTTPVRAPVLDLENEAGGLTPVKLGGGQQTTSLQLDGADGLSYGIRSIDKDALKTVPPSLQHTFAAEFVQDQTAALFPYSSLVAAELAATIGVLHTNPRLVFVPDSPRLGPYRDRVGGQLMFFDVRPTTSASPSITNAGKHKILDGIEVRKKLEADNDNQIDQRAFARVRLLDLLIADWDRGVTQWVWIEYGSARDSSGLTFKPFPKDRDWAFNRMDGLFPRLAPLIMGRFQSFGKNYGSLQHLSHNGLAQDRRFLNRLTKSDWITIADSVRLQLTDAAISNAVRTLPEPIYLKEGRYLEEALIHRRDELTKAAIEFYELHNRVVDVTGTNKHESFEVVRSGDSTVVTVRKLSKSGEDKGLIYKRTFFRDETREIRLFGLGGNDKFSVAGVSGKPIRIRAIGGPGADSFSQESGAAKRATSFVDDDRTENSVDSSSRLRRSADPAMNTYSEYLYSANHTFPQFFFGSNRDDGVFVGGGFRTVKQDFRKSPFSRSHRLVGNVASHTGAFNVDYSGRWVDILRSWDAVIGFQVRSPKNIRNFYGLGNETTSSDFGSNYFRARLAQARFSPGVYKAAGPNSHMEVNTSLTYTKVDSTGSGFLSSPEAFVPQSIFDHQVQIGIEAQFRFADLDDPQFPTRGFSVTGNVGYFESLTGIHVSYGVIRATSSYYLKPIPTIPGVLALRFGGGHNFGAFPFYEAQTLGGQLNLRGFRANRFSGQSSFYTNIESRIVVWNFATFLATGNVGLSGFLDNGRVWAPEESSRTWHQGYGGGVWFRFFDSILIDTSLALSTDDRTFSVRFGFLY